MKNLFKALAAFQRECPVIKKMETAKVLTRSGGQYEYHYAGLPSIQETIKPILEKHGLMVIQPLGYETEHGNTLIETKLIHIESGESSTSITCVPKVSFGNMNEYQALGSGITYLRRYALSSILGIVTDEDNDGAAGQGGKINHIENLLRTCTLSPEEKRRIEIEMVEFDADRIERCIAYLKANQRDPIESGDNYNQADIQHKLDLKMEDDKS